MNDIEITSVEDDIIKITETVIPDGYYKLFDGIYVVVEKEVKDYEYVVKSVQLIPIDEETREFAQISIEGNKITVKILNEKVSDSEYELEIVKQDAENESQLLPGAYFSIATNGKTAVEHGPTTEDGALSLGKITITGLGNDTIVIKETKAPEGYNGLPSDIKLNVKKKIQDFTYIIDSITAQNISNSAVSMVGNKITITVPNTEKRTNIGGTVWLDIPPKSGKRDNKLGNDETSDDKRFAGISVYLYLADNLEEAIKETKTKDDGTYVFENVKQNRNYVVKFEYPGQQYIPVEYVSLNDENYTNVDSTAKEADSDRTALNNKFHEILKGKAKGTDGAEIELEYEMDSSKHISTLIRDYEFNSQTLITASTESFHGGENYVGHINLGLYERKQADLNVVVDVKKVNLVINGENNDETSTIGFEKKRDDQAILIDYKTDYMGLTKNHGDTAKIEYNPTIYESDYKYRIDDYKKHEGEELVKIEKEGQSDIEELSDEEQKRELEAYITYKILLYNASTESANVSGLKVYFEDAYGDMPVKSWVKLEDKKGDYKEEGQDVIWQKVSSSSETGNNYNVISTDSLKDITIGSSGTLYVFVKFKVEKDPVTRAIDTSENIIIAEISSYTTEKGLIDSNSQPDNVNPTDYNNTFEYDTDIAPGLKLNIIEDKRTMTGFVWEDLESEQDTNENDGVKIGNGLFESGEKKQNGVTVQLIELVNVGSKTYEYIWQQTETGGKILKYVDTGGTVKETEVQNADGEYKFIGYIPGRYIVRFIYGENVVDKEIILSGQEYKSTKYHGNYEPNASHATDDLYRRYEVMENAKKEDADYNNLEWLKNNTWMFADTRNDEGAIKIGIYEKEHNDSINFGVIARPVAKIEVTDEIVGTKIVNKGIVLVDTEQGITEYVRMDQPNSWNIELDDEVTNGAEMEIAYQITIKNTGEKDTLFNYFGGQTLGGRIVGIEKQKEAAMTEVLAMYDKPEKLGYKNQEDGWEKVDGEEDLTLKTTELLGKLAAGETKTISLKLSKIMTIGSNDDLSTSNVALVAKAKDDVGRSVGDSAKSGTARVTVTDPTGRKMNYSILWLGVTTLFTIGVIAIKKKVLS